MATMTCRYANQPELAGEGFLWALSEDSGENQRRTQFESPGEAHCHSKALTSASDYVSSRPSRYSTVRNVVGNVQEGMEMDSVAEREVACEEVILENEKYFDLDSVGLDEYISYVGENGDADEERVENETDTETPGDKGAKSWTPVVEINVGDDCCKNIGDSSEDRASDVTDHPRKKVVFLSDKKRLERDILRAVKFLLPDDPRSRHLFKDNCGRFGRGEISSGVYFEFIISLFGPVRGLQLLQPIKEMVRERGLDEDLRAVEKDYKKSHAKDIREEKKRLKKESKQAQKEQQNQGHKHDEKQQQQQHCPPKAESKVGQGETRGVVPTISSKSLKGVKTLRDKKLEGDKASAINEEVGYKSDNRTSDSAERRSDLFSPTSDTERVASVQQLISNKSTNASKQEEVSRQTSAGGSDGEGFVKPKCTFRKFQALSRKASKRRLDAGRVDATSESTLEAPSSSSMTESNGRLTETATVTQTASLDQQDGPQDRFDWMRTHSLAVAQETSFSSSSQSLNKSTGSSNSSGSSLSLSERFIVGTSGRTLRRRRSSASSKTSSESNSLSLSKPANREVLQEKDQSMGEELVFEKVVGGGTKATRAYKQEVAWRDRASATSGDYAWNEQRNYPGSLGKNSQVYSDQTSDSRSQMELSSESSQGRTLPCHSAKSTLSNHISKADRDPLAPTEIWRDAREAEGSDFQGFSWEYYLDDDTESLGHDEEDIALWRTEEEALSFDYKQREGRKPTLNKTKVPDLAERYNRVDAGEEQRVQGGESISAYRSKETEATNVHVLAEAPAEENTRTPLRNAASSFTSSTSYAEAVGRDMLLESMSRTTQREEVEQGPQRQLQQRQRQQQQPQQWQQQQEQQPQPQVLLSAVEAMEGAEEEEAREQSLSVEGPPFTVEESSRSGTFFFDSEEGRRRVTSDINRETFHNWQKQAHLFELTSGQGGVVELLETRKERKIYDDGEAQIDVDDVTERLRQCMARIRLQGVPSSSADDLDRDGRDASNGPRERTVSDESSASPRAPSPRRKGFFFSSLPSPSASRKDRGNDQGKGKAQGKNKRRGKDQSKDQSKQQGSAQAPRGTGVSGGPPKRNERDRRDNNVANSLSGLQQPPDSYTQSGFEAETGYGLPYAGLSGLERNLLGFSREPGGVSYPDSVLDEEWRLASMFERVRLSGTEEEIGRITGPVASGEINKREKQTTANKSGKAEAALGPSADASVGLHGPDSSSMWRAYPTSQVSGGRSSMGDDLRFSEPPLKAPPEFRGQIVKSSSIFLPDGGVGVRGRVGGAAEPARSTASEGLEREAKANRTPPQTPPCAPLADAAGTDRSEAERRMSAKFSIIDLFKIAGRMRQGIPIRSRRHRLKLYFSCFVGHDCVEWLKHNDLAASSEEAVALGNVMLRAGIFHAVSSVQDAFSDSGELFRFAKDNVLARSSKWTSTGVFA